MSTAVTPIPVTPTGIEATEPSRLVGVVGGVVNAVFAGLTAYGITYKADLPHLITTLVIALVTFFAFVLPVVMGEVTRGKVWSAASVARIAAAIVTDAPPVIAAGEAIVKDVTPAAPDGAPAHPVAAQPATA